ncbi:hypothetical protein SPRG_20378 [Saprolegnia parasitica CBS 223.65]|uniref:Uncharacterized protein n=1 Tax=Saprolegnia parasitica (strain CBS 223.65) TaxID=695850 RepID=A0A067CMI9_SAPPC|nr:hypothetical protein SPRG_20378 [Saprolegnia parasitica CBS 223.65]KDO27736.1 hypothetical protein SPRG_20378 [Saprolegnia parasitica CBS 223.65]|eukprot:XP_012201608.1 hypothetical protein SPRG_20378 [Saprolegnia parasitica CBS 223.65]
MVDQWNWERWRRWAVVASGAVVGDGEAVAPELVVVVLVVLKTPSAAKRTRITTITTRPRAIVSLTFFHHMARERLLPVFRKTLACSLRSLDFCSTISIFSVLESTTWMFSCIVLLTASTWAMTSASLSTLVRSSYVVAMTPRPLAHSLSRPPSLTVASLAANLAAISSWTAVRSLNASRTG